MKLTSSDIHTFYKPSRCQRRVYLIEHPPETLTEAENDYYSHAEEVDYHVERYYYKRFKKPIDLSQTPAEKREKATIKAMKRQGHVIYKPFARYLWNYQNKSITLEATPDFVLWEDAGYVLRYCRMAKKVTRDNHGDIFWIAQFHAWVFYQVFGQWPLRLEVGNSTGKVMTLPLPESGAVESFMARLIDLRCADTLPYHPVSWTKCQSCIFKDHCWQIAEQANDIALVPNLEAKLLLALRDAGVMTVAELPERYDVQSLARFTFPAGQTERPVGKAKAESMLQMAQAMLSNKPLLKKDPQLPETPHWMMFDLEAVPARPGQPEKVYLWGMHLKGERDENLQLISTTMNRQADRDNWFDFLEQCSTIFDTYGEMPFVHWGNFESYCLKLYVKRFGDRHGVAQRIQRNLLDLFQVLKNTAVIPLPSYSLKVIEKYVGFERSDQDTGGYWSVVNYLKSVNTKNAARREEIMEQLLTYNASDLEAMWQVMCWFEDLIQDFYATSQ